MHDLIAKIDDRGLATPRMTAIRWGGSAVSFGELRDAVAAYDRVASAAGLSELAGLSAALMSLLPARARALDPEVQGTWVAQAIAWLSRDAEDRVSVTAVV